MYDPFDAAFIRADRTLERERLADHQARLIKFCELTKRGLEHIEEADTTRFQRLYDKWFRCFILDYTLHAHRDTAPSIFGALCQANFILAYPHITRETARLKELGYFPDDEDLLIRRMLRKNDETPIWMMSQSEVLDAMLYVSEKLNHIERRKIDGLSKKVEALFTRCSVFFCETDLGDDVLDVPDMREDGHVNATFLRYCSIYFNAVFRRLFYYELVHGHIASPLDTAAAEARVQEFIEVTVCNFLGEENIEDLYMMACEDAYRFPGDKQWYQFLYPEYEALTGDVLQQTRPLYAKSFYTENRVSKAPILAAAASDQKQRGYCGRTFVLEALSRYVAAYYHFNNWKNCCVISNRQMSTTEAHIKMQRGKMPLLIQFCSRYWVYDRKTVWATDNIYCALATWLYILKHRYKSTLIGTSFKRLIDKIWQSD